MFKYVLQPGIVVLGVVAVGEGVCEGGTNVEVGVEVGVDVDVDVGGVDVTGVEDGGVVVADVAVVGTTVTGVDEGVIVGKGVPATLISTHHG